MLCGFCCVFPGWYHVTLLSVWFHLSISTCSLHQRPSGRSRSHCALWVSRGFDNYLSTPLLPSERQETHTDNHISVARIFYVSVMLGWVESCPISLEEIDFYQRICRKIPLCRLQSLTWFSLVSILAKSPPCFKQNCLASCHRRREMASEKGK